MLKTIVSVILAMTAVFTNLQGFFSKPKTYLTDGVFLKYGAAANQCMDIFMPENPGDTVDVVLTIHGGSWMYGDQLQFDEYAKQAAKYGYVGVSMDHRKLNNNVRAQGMNEDILNAVAAVKRYLNDNGLSAGKMVVAGHSSGAHLALLYSYTHYKDSPIPIAFVTAASAPGDLVLFAQGSMTASNNYFLMTALSDENITAATVGSGQARALLAKINPIDLVTPEVPPTILLHGDMDEIVPYECADRLYKTLRSNGVDAQLLTYKGQVHSLNLAPEKMKQARLELMLSWAEKYLVADAPVPETTGAASAPADG